MPLPSFSHRRTGSCTMNPHKPNTLLGLPAEIRHQIFELTLPEPDSTIVEEFPRYCRKVNHYVPTNTHKAIALHPLRALCRQTRFDFEDRVRKLKTFRFTVQETERSETIVRRLKSLFIARLELVLEPLDVGDSFPDFGRQMSDILDIIRPMSSALQFLRITVRSSESEACPINTFLDDSRFAKAIVSTAFAGFFERARLLEEVSLELRHSRWSHGWPSRREFKAQDRIRKLHDEIQKAHLAYLYRPVTLHEVSVNGLAKGKERLETITVVSEVSRVSSRDVLSESQDSKKSHLPKLSTREKRVCDREVVGWIIE